MENNVSQLHPYFVEQYGRLRMRCVYEGCQAIFPFAWNNRHTEMCTYKFENQVMFNTCIFDELYDFRLTGGLQVTSTLLAEGGFSEPVVGFFKNGGQKEIPVVVKFVGRGESRILRVAHVLRMKKNLGNHQKLLATYGVTICYNSVNLVSELAPYRTLYDVLNNTEFIPSLPACLILAWMVDISDALRFIHSKQISHNAIYLQNIFVFPMLHIKLGDLDCSGERSTPASDVYSFGITSLKIINYRLTQSLGVKEAVANMGLNRQSDDLINLLTNCMQQNEGNRPSSETVFQCCTEILEANGCDPREKRNPSHALLKKFDAISSKAVSSINLTKIHLTYISSVGELRDMPPWVNSFRRIIKKISRLCALVVAHVESLCAILVFVSIGVILSFCIVCVGRIAKLVS
jgi:serine/threonine protein kinase